MIELVIASRIAHDEMRRQFAGPPRRAPRATTSAPVVAEPRAPVRRATVRALRVLADRLEPAPRCVQA
jgi:hypothetical protein